MQNKTEQFTDKELKESYWIVTHAAAVRLWITRSVIVAEALMVLFILIGLAWYGYFALVRSKTIVEPLRASLQYVHLRFALEEPIVLTDGVVDHGTGSIDLYALLENSQSQWRVDFDVLFSIQGIDQAPVPLFLLPGERKYALKLGIVSSQVQDTDVRIENIVWQRLSPSDIQRVKLARVTQVSDFAVQSGRTLTGVPILGTQALFSIQNKGVYDLYDFRIPVVIKRGTTPVAVTIVPVFSLPRGKKLPLEARWDYSFSGSEYDITPDIDVLNESHAKPSL